jgi:hypothetical protein
MMHAVWGYVVFVGLRIVGFACGSHVGVERDSRVTHSCGNTFMLCILMLCTSYLNFVRCSIFLRKQATRSIITYVEMLVPWFHVSQFQTGVNIC